MSRSWARVNYAGARSLLEQLDARRGELTRTEADLLEVVTWLFEECGMIAVMEHAKAAVLAPRPEPHGRRPSVSTEQPHA